MAIEAHVSQATADRHEPFHYLASADPGAVGAGKWWVDITIATAPILKQRNAANDGWIVASGNGSEYLLGATSVQFTVPPGSIGGTTIIPGNANIYFYPIRFASTKPFTVAWWLQGTVSAGNLDVGIYSSADAGVNLSKVASTGSVAAATASTLGSAALTASFTPVYGTDYWAAVCTDSATARIMGNAGFICNNAKSSRLLAQVGVPLPNTAIPSAGVANFACIGFA